MNRCFRFGLAAAALAAAAFEPAAAAETTLRYNRWLPANHHLEQNVFIPWMRKVEEVTQGRVKIEPTTSSLGPITEQYNMASTGVADIVFTAESWSPGLFPLAEILQLPFLGTDVEKLSVAYWKVYKAHFEAVSPYPRVEVLALTGFPIYHLFTKGREVREADDLKNLKIVTTGETRSKYAKNLGLTPIAAGLTQTVEMVSTGVADGTLITDDAVNSFGMTRAITHRTTFAKGLGSASGVLLVNARKWARISEKDRSAIGAISGEVLTRQMGASLKAADERARAAALKKGVKTIVAGPKLEAHFEKIAAPLEAEWIAIAKAKGVDGEAALAMLRRLVQ